MYSVTYNGKLLYRSGTGELPAYDLHLSESENSPAAFSFQIPESHPLSGILEAGRAEIAVYDSRDGSFSEEHEIFRGKISGIETDFQNGQQVECEGVLAYLANSIQRPSEQRNKTVSQLLSYLLGEHNKQASLEERIYPGTVTVSGSLNGCTDYKTTLECMKEMLLKEFGGRLMFRRQDGKNYLDYLDGYRDNGSQPIEFGRNLLNFSRNLDASEIYTVCIPLGARQENGPIEGQDTYLTIESVNGGKDYVENLEATALYGRKTKVVSWKDVTSPGELKKKGEQWLVSNQYETLSLDVSAIDLSMTGEDFESFKLGDETLVYSRPHGLKRTFPITKRNRYLDAPEKNTITLGKNIVRGIVGSIRSGREEAREQISKIPSGNQILSTARKNATDLITAAMNGYVVTSSDEILIMDEPRKETAKKVWRWNLGGLAYSGTGYEGPYKTAMTMDGEIVADFITAGVLSGIIIKSFRDEFYGEYGTEIQSGKVIEWANGRRLAELTMKGDFSKKPELKDITFAIRNSPKSKGFVIEFGDEDESDPNSYAAVRFECEDGEKSKQKSTFYRKQDFCGEQFFYGGSTEYRNSVDFKNETNFNHNVNMKYPLRLYKPDGTFCGKLEVSGNDGNVILAGVSGKSKAALGYTDDESAGVGGIVEVSTAWTDYRARINGGLKITGDFAATGTKNRIVDVGDKKILMNAYETADCLFGDLGSGIFNSKGELSVTLDETFRETIEGDYSIFVCGYAGEVIIKEKTETGFMLTGRPKSRVDYEIRGKQKGYTNIRMKEFKEGKDGKY